MSKTSLIGQQLTTEFGRIRELEARCGMPMSHDDDITVAVGTYARRCGHVSFEGALHALTAELEALATVGGGHAQ